MITAAETNKVNRMSAAMASVVAKGLFGGEVYASAYNGKRRIMCNLPGLAVTEYGRGSTWCEAFRDAARTLGLVG